MEIQKNRNVADIYENEQIATLLGQCLYNPTDGKIQSIAQSVYSKTQGVFYTCQDEAHVVGIIGGTEIDKVHLILNHIAVTPDRQRQGIGKAMMVHLFKTKRYHLISATVKENMVPFFKACGFQCKKQFDPILETTTYHCERKIQS